MKRKPTHKVLIGKFSHWIKTVCWKIKHRKSSDEYDHVG
jgi:hypothetical protein